ncbi:hypothetical protein ACFP51_30985 [Streptomyces pratens]|uniref:Uncharacterized protein n=1 Tax=Streptomyces pratens TaxID=887456 RepID=A0ABW1LT95_9ACTN
MRMPPATSGRYRDRARPGVVLVRRAGAMGLDFGTVVIPGTETDAAADSTAAATPHSAASHPSPV